MMTTIRFQLSSIPTPLRSRPQWVVWKYGQLKPNGKRAKIPFDAQTGMAASTTDPATWSGFEQAATVYKAGGYIGVGYVLKEDDPFTFIDLDNCIRNGELAPDAMATITRFASYTERSVSGSGVHIVVEGAAPNRKNERAEVYSDRRFIAITGDIVAEQRDIHPRQSVLDPWCAETFPSKEQPTPAHPGASHTDLLVSDDALLDIIYNSKQARKFASLMAGDTASYKSPSEADAALCAMLAFWTNHDAGRIDRIFRLSGLMRDKWDRTGDGATQRTYGELTIDEACRQVVNDYKPTPASNAITRLCQAWRQHFAGQAMHSATQRVLLATIRKFDDTQSQATYISSRNISDLTGLSHRAVQMHLRLLCPQTRGARIKRLEKDLNRVGCQLRSASNATTAEEMLLVLRPQEREGIVSKLAGADEATVMAEVVIFLHNRRDRALNELKFYANHPALDLLDCTEAHDGSAFATVYTLRTLQNVSTERINTVGGVPPNSDHNQCGNILQSSDAALQFIEANMNDDAFVVAPPTKVDPRLKLEPDPVKRARLAKLLDIDAKLKPFGLSAPRVFAALDGNEGADIETLTVATGVSERTVRNVFKAAGAALVESGYLPLVEVTKEGRRHIYRLVDDWKERVDALRADLSTNGVIIARAVHHAGERIRRIDSFLEKGQRDSRRQLDDATRAQYEAIKQRAQLLKAQLLTGKVEQAPANGMSLSNALVVIEAQLAPIQPIKAVQPVVFERLYLGHAGDERFGERYLVTT